MTTSTIDVLKGQLHGYNVQIEKPPKPAKVVTPLTEAQLEQKEIIRESLKQGTWIIEFVKTDGTNSIMEATLDPALLPIVDPDLPKPAPRTEAPHLLHVYAIDRLGWRSFVVANLTKIYRPNPSA